MIENVPLDFEVPEQVTHQREGEQRQSIKSVAFALCPGCRRGTNTGLVPEGAHLVWRIHTTSTVSGRPIICSMSGQRVCEHPPRKFGPVVMCRCVR